MMSPSRRQQLALLTRLVLAERDRTSHTTLRVAITGITASGKSTLADELVEHLNAQGAACFRVPVDGFHNPRAIRHRRGRESPEGYYYDAYDYRLLQDTVLLPLGPNGDSRYLACGFDLDADAPTKQERVVAPSGSIAILDASFLLRPEVRDAFDYRIFVQTSFEEAEARGVRRDAAALGGEDTARRLFRLRYHAAQRLYFREAQPLQHADVLWMNEDPHEPAVFLRPS